MAQYFTHKGLAFIRLNNPPLNALSVAVRQGLMAALDTAQTQRDKICAVVLVGEGRAFSAGADISEFAKGRHNMDPSLREVIHRLDGFERPLIAVVNGLALGGGLETALPHPTQIRRKENKGSIGCAEALTARRPRDCLSPAPIKCLRA